MQERFKAQPEVKRVPVSIPLHRFAALQSRNVDEAIASIVTRQPGVHHFEPVFQPKRRWGIDVNFVALHRIGVTSTRSSAYSLNSSPDGFLRVFAPFGTSFRTDFKAGAQVFQSGSAAIAPLEDYRAHFRDGFATLLVTIPMALMDEATQRLGAKQAVATLLQGRTEAASTGLGLFTAHLAFIVRSLDEHEAILDVGRFKALHEELLTLHLANALLRAEPAEGRMISSGALRRAIDAIAGRITEDFRIADIADHAGCSIRSLQTAFQTQFQTTISGYVRAERLQTARRRLEAPDAAATVTSIALESGFNHLSDFARHYREAYGERPSATLHRVRQSRLRLS